MSQTDDMLGSKTSTCATESTSLQFFSYCLNWWENVKKRKQGRRALRLGYRAVNNVTYCLEAITPSRACWKQRQTFPDLGMTTCPVKKFWSDHPIRFLSVTGFVKIYYRAALFFTDVFTINSSLFSLNAGCPSFFPPFFFLLLESTLQIVVQQVILYGTK